MNLPVPFNPAVWKRLLEQSDAANRKRRQNIELDANERLVLRSPNGTRYALTVDDTGALSAEAL